MSKSGLVFEAQQLEVYNKALSRILILLSHYITFWSLYCSK